MDQTSTTLCVHCKYFHSVHFQYENTIKFKCLINLTLFDNLVMGHYKLPSKNLNYTNYSEYPIVQKCNQFQNKDN